MFCSIYGVGLNYDICLILSLASDIIRNIVYTNFIHIIVNNLYCQKNCFLEKLRIVHFMLKKFRKTLTLKIFV